jgi:hypothetical protein
MIFMKKFEARTTKPEKGNPYYNTKSKGGYSTAIVGSPTDPDCNVLSNCVGFCFGRVNEILGDKTMPILEPRNAETWVEIAKKQGHKIYQSPKVGDVMCWAKGSAKNSADGAGHVAVVEKVYSDQMVLTSESGWKAAKPFWTLSR